MSSASNVSTYFSRDKELIQKGIHPPPLSLHRQKLLLSMMVENTGQQK